MRRGAICASASACKASFERKKRGIYCKQPLKKYNLKTQKVRENALSHEKCRTIIRKLAPLCGGRPEMPGSRNQITFIEKTGRMCYFI